MSYIGRYWNTDKTTRTKKLDTIAASFNGAQTVFNLTCSAVAVYPAFARNLIINLDGVQQEPDIAYTVTGSQITFTTAPRSNASFYGVLLGDLVDIKYASNNTLLTTVTGTQNDFAHNNADVVYCNNASNVTFTGLAAGYDGQEITFISSNTSGHVFFAHANTASAVGARLLNLVTSNVTPLRGGTGVARYRYNGPAAQWQLVYHRQGSAIQRTFSAGNFTAAGSMTWTVIGGSVATDSYLIEGRRLVSSFDIGYNTIGGVANTFLKMDCYGYTIANRYVIPFNYVDGDNTTGTGCCFVSGNDTFISFYKNRGLITNWATGAFNVVSGTFTLDIV